MDELYMGTEERQAKLGTEPDELRDEPVVQTETVSDAPSAEDDMDPESAAAGSHQSGTQRRRERRVRPAPVVSIDDRLGVETDADKARDAMLDLVESLKTRRILSGTVQGIERPGDGTNSVAVIYHGDFKVLIPAEEMVEKPEDTRSRSVSDALHYKVSIAENAQIIELEVTNDPIRGSITLTKYDADYPDNRLTGAVFEVYRDVNGGRVPDDGDELLGEMDDEGEGVYWMRELDAGGYLVREAEAPEGYVLDEAAYYVEITTDGEVCVVENEADVGFVNQPLRGALKIVKTTDDGRVEGYEIAEPVTVTLVANETLTVNVHNNKITVDVPKTGDGSLTPWIILIAAGLAGVADVSAYCYFGVYRKGKGGKRNEKA